MDLKDGILAAETAALEALVDAFAARMKAKLRRKAFDGHRGWADPACVPAIREALRRHADKGDPVDVANFAAMLWNHREPT